MDSIVVAKVTNKDSKDKEKKSSSSSKSKDSVREKERDEKDAKKSSNSKSSGTSKQHERKSGRGESPTASKRRHRSRSVSDSEEPIKKTKSSHRSNEDGSNAEGDGGGGGGGDLSLSIEETNKLRAKLGLKPLSADDSTKKSDPSKPNTYIDKKTYEEFEHKPAMNMAEQREQKEFRRKLEEQREKRRMMERLEKLNHKEEGEEEDESAEIWLRKIKEKEEAKKKAAMLEEMDKQFEETSETTTERPARRRPGATYDERNLSGFKVEHDINNFKEGQQIVLTLKDRGIVRGAGDNLELDEEEDALVNVNIADDERAAKNVELRKKKPDYVPYDDFDEDGNFKVKGVLEKYNEELDGPQKKSFKLGARGVYDLSDEKFIAQLNEEHKSRAIKLDATDFKITTDYYTAEEMERFKKPKKVRKVLRKGRAVKADDLLPLEPMPTSVKSKETVKSGRETAAGASSSNNEASTGGKVSLKDIDFGLEKTDEKSSDEDEGEVKSEARSESDNNDDNDDDDDDDFLDTAKLNKRREDDEELKKILDEENEELANMLSKTRKRVIAPLALQIKPEKIEPEDNGVDFDKLEKAGDDDMVLDTISEFCRNIKTEPQSGNADDDDDEDADLVSRRKKKESDDLNMDENDDDEGLKNGNGTKDSSDEKSDDDEETMEKKSSDGEEDTNILDAEPILNRGVMSAILLATNKGYLAESKQPTTSRTKEPKSKADSIQAANYTIEERTYYDIDDKYNRNRNDRYSSGPLMDFDEKKGYKPDVKLNYFDEKGRSMNEKEAFRYLSHRFHGKGPGKIKTEKRLNKIMEAEAMNKMSSVDTPLNTVALMQEKQKKLQQPYVVLSARKKDQPDHIAK